MTLFATAHRRFRTRDRAEGCSETLYAKHFLALLLLAFLGRSLGAKVTVQRGVVKAVNMFAWDMYKQLSQSRITENVFFSPLSISAAFSAVYLGAKGNSKKEIGAVLGFNKDSIPTTLLRADELLSSMEGDSVIINFANKLFLQENFEVEPTFIKDVGRTRFSELDFAQNPAEARDIINKYVSNQTQGQISQLLPENVINGLTRLVVANAIFFKGAWAEKFDQSKTKKAVFKGVVKEVQTDFMEQRGAKMKYITGGFLGNAELLEIPYAGGNYSMFILLPSNQAANGFDTLQKKRTVDVFALMSEMKEVTVNLRLPKFEIEDEIDLKDQLSIMGIKEVFDANLANLKGISRVGLFVSDAIHKSRIKVDEEGTTAVAATAVVAELKTFCSDTVDFIADHPFIYFLVDNENGMVLFIGNVKQFSETE